MKFGNEIAQRIRLLEERGKTKTRAAHSGKEPGPPAQVGPSSAVCTLHLAAVNSAGSSTDEYVCVTTVTSKQPCQQTYDSFDFRHHCGGT